MITHQRIEVIPLEEGLSLIPSGYDRSLLELSLRRPLRVAMLRHAGCIFCRAHLEQLAACQTELSARGEQLVLVSTSPAAELAPLAQRYGLNDVMIVSDPRRVLYRALDLRRMSAADLPYGMLDLWAAIGQGWLLKHGLTLTRSDLGQLHGVALIARGQLQSLRRARYASEPCQLTAAIE